VFILESINLFVLWAVAAIVGAAVVLIILRVIFNYADVNPFTWHARNVRRATDPVLAPARAILMGMRLDPSVAPLIVVVFILVAGYLLVQVAGTLLNTVAGVLFATTSHRPDMTIAIVGYLLFGLIGLYNLAIIVRIVFVWIGMSYANPWNKLLVKITEPLLAPLRRLVPMVGMFDISPIIAFIILWVCQAAVAKTLLAKWPLGFF
jgi:YggT family protein